MEWNVKTIHKMDDGGVAALELESADGMWDVNIRWDGCAEIHLYTQTEERFELRDSVHTCDLQGFVEALQSLQEACRPFFGGGDRSGRESEALPPEFALPH